MTYQNKTILFEFYAELQIKRNIEENSFLIFLFLKGNICCVPSLEPSRRDGSNDGSHNMFYYVFMRNSDNYL